MLHSGSRGIGYAIATYFVERFLEERNVGEGLTP
ncbi:hypothetical protein CKCBHOJB_01530 [Thauera sp. GDN1]|nr:hypothetical protein CKCBHOJB_01530 [Thauera sp. GDN1]